MSLLSRHHGPSRVPKYRGTLAAHEDDMNFFGSECAALGSDFAHSEAGEVTLGKVMESQRRVENFLQHLAAKLDDIREGLQAVQPSQDSPEQASSQAESQKPPRMQQLSVPASAMVSISMDSESSTIPAKTSRRRPVLSLPDDWPGSLTMQRLFSDRTMINRASCQRHSSEVALAHHVDDGDVLPTARPPWFVIQPTSSLRISLELIVILCLLYDLSVIPLVLAWDFKQQGYAFVLTLVTSLVGTAEIVMNFFTACDCKGERVYSLKKIARRYFRGWCFLDAFVVLSNWMGIAAELLASDRTSGGSAGRTLKLLRLLRVSSFLRTLKASSKADRLFEADVAAGTAWAAMIIFGLMCLIHWLACGWYYLGRLGPTDTGHRWTDAIEEEGLWYQYLTSAHFSATQVTLGSSDVGCANSMERFVNVVLLMVGLMFNSAFTSTLSATMVDARAGKKESSLKLRIMKRFLAENHVSFGLTVQAQYQLMKRMKQKDPLREDEVLGLSLLTDRLRGEVKFSMYQGCLKQHCLMRLWIAIHPEGLRRFCCEHVRLLNVKTEDRLFSAGDRATGAYFCESGKLVYKQDPVTAFVGQRSTEVVSQGAWLAEAALWSDWTHVGTSSALSSSRVVAMNTDSVLDMLMRSNNAVVQITIEYCKAFHRQLQAAKPPAADFPSDLQVPNTDWQFLLPRMSAHVRGIVAREALRCCSLSADDEQRLLQEVGDGSLSILHDVRKGALAVSSVLAVSISNDEGKLLVQLGVAAGRPGSVTWSCHLPCVKYTEDLPELVTDLMQRLFEEKLAPFVGRVLWTHTSRSSEHANKDARGLCAQALKHVCHFKLDDGVDTGTPPVQRFSAGRDWAPTPPRRASSMSSRSSALSLSSLAAPAPAWPWARSRTRSSRSSDESSSGQAVLRNLRDVICICDAGGRRLYYAWLSQSDMEALQHSNPSAMTELMRSWFLSAESSTCKDRDEDVSALEPASV